MSNEQCIGEYQHFPNFPHPKFQVQIQKKVKKNPGVKMQSRICSQKKKGIAMSMTNVFFPKKMQERNSSKYVEGDPLEAIIKN